MDRRLDRTHKPRAHIFTALTRPARTSPRTRPVREAPRNNKRHAQTLPRPAQQDEIRDIVLGNMSRTLKTIDRQKIFAELDGALRVADRGALVEHDAAVFLYVSDGGPGDCSGLDDADSFFDGDAKSAP